MPSGVVPKARLRRDGRGLRPLGLRAYALGRWGTWVPCARGHFVALWVAR